MRGLLALLASSLLYFVSSSVRWPALRRSRSCASSDSAARSVKKLIGCLFAARGPAMEEVQRASRKSHSPRYSRCVIDVVSLGTPPKPAKAPAGFAYGLDVAPRRIHSLQKHGVKRVYSGREADTSGYLPDAQGLAYFESTVSKTKSDIATEMKPDVASDVTIKVKPTEGSPSASEARTRLVSAASDHWLDSYKNLLIRRLFQEWLKTSKGRLARDRATTELSRTYSGRGLGTCGDFVSESKSLRSQLSEAKELKDQKNEANLRWKEEQVKKIAETILVPSCSGAGYMDAIAAYQEANCEVHKAFTDQQLDDIMEDSTLLSTSAASQWLVEFAKDLRYRS